MGRVGEVIIRTFQTAHKMKVQRGPLSQDSDRNDNYRVKRYISKVKSIFEPLGLHQEVHK